ncbi:hypothetical protein IEQ34_011169 [Dendrobium chrysotoxum]|uniref:Uncharacterized protein n=1 Tax=Dendrobium chrysotoxum TaxID=161865 RepID=A0AAV7GWS6_DENCH|nr:hypothetical protein IEQ34_011169 [Dendrobium chrysotoxum]
MVRLSIIREGSNEVISDKSIVGKKVVGKGGAGCDMEGLEEKNGIPPGILCNEIVNHIPNLFKIMINRLITSHVLPISYVPNSCIINIYEPGDGIPPHIDNHDFVRSFCTVSFLSKCNINIWTQGFLLDKAKRPHNFKLDSDFQNIKSSDFSDASELYHRNKRLPL